MTRRTPTLIAGVLLLVAAPGATAQQRVTLDVRAAVAMSTADLGDADLGTGFGVGGILAVRVQPHLHLYGGWDWLLFTADQSFAGPDRDFEQNGYTFGLRFEHPLRAGGGAALRVEGGGVYQHLEIEADDGTLVSDSGHELGFEGGIGVVVPLGAAWWVGPMVRFRSVAFDFEVASLVTSATHRLVALELGFTRRW